MEPIIGLAGNLLEERNSSGIERSYVNDDYVAATARSGAIPLILPLVRDLRLVERQMEGIHGLLVPGGYDVDPLLYGEEPRARLGYVYRDTDLFQLETIRLALKRRMPVLAICKGIQLLNVLCGGTLNQDLSEVPGKPLKHDQEMKRSVPSHTVTAEEGSIVRRLLGASFPTNSFHHQTLKEIGEGLRVTARSADGAVEAVEMDGFPFVVGVQWHPEMMMSGGDAMLPLFQAFVGAAERFMGEAT